jgi:hypothetical protein
MEDINNNDLNPDAPKFAHIDIEEYKRMIKEQENDLKEARQEIEEYKTKLHNLETYGMAGDLLLIPYTEEYNRVHYIYTDIIRNLKHEINGYEFNISLMEKWIGYAEEERSGNK